MKIFSFLRKIPAACTCFLLILDAKSALRKLEKPSISPPKRPASPYILFAGRRIAALIESESDTDSKKRLVQAAVKVGGEWSSMSEEEKKPYFEEYESAKRDYESRVQEYLSTRSPSDAFLEEKAWSLKKDAGRKSIRPFKDINKPVSPLRTYIQFSNAVRKDPSAFNIDLPSNFIDQTSVISKAWKSLDASKKEEFLKDYQDQLLKYKSMMKEYESNIMNVKDSVKATMRAVKKRVVKKKKVVEKVE